jgi:hypothetical protein
MEEHLSKFLWSSTSLPDVFRRAAPYVDKLLRGAKHAALSVEYP